MVKVKVGKCTIETATEAHIEAIYPFMREMDKLEASCMGFDPKEALEVALGADDLTLTAIDPNGVPFAMFGVGGPKEKGWIWMLGTKGIEENRYDFIKASFRWIQIIIEEYDYVFNYVHKSNENSIKWLKFCGAVIGNSRVFNNEPFYEFTIHSVKQELVKKQDFRDRITDFEKEMLPDAMSKEEVDKLNPLEHDFGDELYVRKIVMPAGQLIVSKIHKKKHPYFIMEGDVSVLTESGVQRIKGPYHGMTEAGTKRVLYTHKETTWITVQHTKETNLNKVEEDVMAEDFNDPDISIETLKLLQGE